MESDALDSAWVSTAEHRRSWAGTTRPAHRPRGRRGRSGGKPASGAARRAHDESAPASWQKFVGFLRQTLYDPDPWFQNSLAAGGLPGVPAVLTTIHSPEHW